MNPDMEPFHEIIDAFHAHAVRHMLIGVAGANCWARDGGEVASGTPREILVSPEPETLHRSWSALRELGFTLREVFTRLPDPCPLDLAREFIHRRATANAYRLRDRFLVELRTHTHGRSFEELWTDRRIFHAGHIELNVPRLRHLLEELMARNVGVDHLAVVTWAQGLHDAREGTAFARKLFAAVRADRAAKLQSAERERELLPLQSPPVRVTGDDAPSPSQ